MILSCIYYFFCIFEVIYILKLKLPMTDPKYKCIIKKLKFPLILLLICWTLNLIKCFLSHSNEIHFADIFTLHSLVFTFFTTLVIIFFNKWKN